MGLLAGPDANKYSGLNEDEFVEKGIGPLAEIFLDFGGYLNKKLETYKVYNRFMIRFAEEDTAMRP